MLRNVKLKLNYLLLFFYLLPVYVLPGIVVTLVKLVRYAGFLWAALLYIENGYYKNKALGLILLLLGSMTVSTIVNRNGYSILLSLIYNIFSASVLTMYIVRTDRYRGIANITAMLSILLIGQALTFLKGGFGELLDSNRMVNTLYLFGIRVEFNNIYIFAVSLILIMWFLWGKSHRLLWVAGIASGVLFIVGEWVSTAIMTTLVLCAVFVVRRFIKNMTLWKLGAVAAIGVIMAFYIKGTNASMLKELIENVLKKDMTFSGRTYIWEQAIDYMKGWHWIFGYGLNSGKLFHLVNGWTADTAHSQYLNLMFYFGVPALLIYVAMIMSQFKWATRLKHEKSKRIITATLIAVIVMGISTTTFRSVYMYVYYTVVCLMPEVEFKSIITV